MSNYYVGPFGLTGSHPYQLPPPRTAPSLQFGSDPFLHQRTPGEKNGSGSAISSSKVAGSQQTNEQLPSVSQLLTPGAVDSRPSSPYPPTAFGIYLAPNGTKDSPQPSIYNDSGTPPSIRRNGVHDISRMPSDLGSQAGSLPPLSQISSLGILRESQLNHTSQATFPAQPLQYGSNANYGFGPREREPEDDSQMENADGEPTSNKNKQAKVRPHVVDERYIEGEGLCYIYADGSHCPKVIDGVPVNANWGITKAGKPRKRLAQACLTCREKKIKCHPNLPKCDQCQKSGRECRFESAPRGHRAMKASHTASRTDRRDSLSSGSYNFSVSSNSLYAMPRASESSTSLPGTNSQSPISDGSVLTPSAMDSAQESLGEPDYPYKPRTQSFGRASLGTDDLSRRLGTHVSPDYSEILMEIKDPDPQDPLACDWSKNPYETDPELAVHYVESYFSYVNDRLYYLFPRRPFLLWLKSCDKKKSLDDNMLLYSMMAMGTIFSDRPDRFKALKRYSRTARYAVEHSQHNLTLQLAQSRIILSLWYYAIGAHVKSWDAVGAAVRTVSGLRYNVESGGVIVGQTQECEYGLHPQALIECRRRTFWIAFLLDRLSCFYTPSSTFISSQSAYLRLPCREEVYESQEYTTVPYFQSFLNQLPLSPDDEYSGISAMATLIDIMSLWGDVSDHVFRLSLIPAEAYSRVFEEFHSTIIRRSDEWTAKLPDHLAFTGVNMGRSIRAKKADAFISIHMLLHATLMKLNRHARYQNLPDGMVDRYIHTTRSHAVEVLRICFALFNYTKEYESSRMVLDTPHPKGIILNPFMGYVILSAVDVLSAGGLMVEISECINLIQGGLTAVRELSRFWDGSIPLVSLIENRLQAMTECLHRPLETEGKIAFLANGPSLDSQVRTRVQQQDLSGKEDLMYEGLPRERFFRALDVGSVPFSDELVLWISESS
ncbi:fungal-specific transcription factor domain-containing protein [Aspergillus ambiguus]|uniref:Zn(II)2Cys6 transcription factor n=1 Tax=Aspergillus ambiguus TaxID=176160 RepID=UPI003CCD986D